ncbi:uncharacterized protein PgNI_07826 [Pyricularia grisea]|uniref:Uncharacterized protein n=1 Tax=Pyricularia grisea TaxID=148305 RepID=A0A6P8B0Q3_PYRGI|nr:uncharacterized protein PgNI_07826 [Pyricularia grisea]TLD08293.1 hypothetical protein PgNI_07826 [Pyricularia grisea]
MVSQLDRTSVLGVLICGLPMVEQLRSWDCRLPTAVVTLASA